METIEYRDVVNKARWPRGPWDSEPDKRQWADPATGLPCMIKRHPGTGNWCGYVGVPEGHPAYEVGYSESISVVAVEPITVTIPVVGSPAVRAAIDAIKIHDGLSFSDRCEKGDVPAKLICHIPAPGEPDKVWWFGFSCGGTFDYMPGTREGFVDDRIEYRPQAYVEAECAKLARQLAAIAA